MLQLQLWFFKKYFKLLIELRKKCLFIVISRLNLIFNKYILLYMQMYLFIEYCVEKKKGCKLVILFFNLIYEEFGKCENI